MIKFTDYELIDFGQGRRLERFGNEILDRPESMALNIEKSDLNEWKKANHSFNETQANSGIWEPSKELTWQCNLRVNQETIKLTLSKGKFKHVGVFPEQISHWQTIERVLNKGDKMLNLFAYTGASSLVGAVSGASVTHIDSSKSIMKVARENAERSGITSIRFIQEDALKFVEREVKRRSFYSLIICDPPVFGIGPKREKWKLEKDLSKLIETLKGILLPNGYLILNTYSPRVSIEDMEWMTESNGFKLQESGWLQLQSSTRKTLQLSKYIISRRSASA